MISGILALILLLSVSAYADIGTIEITGEDISRTVETPMTVSFTVDSEYTIRIPAEKPASVSDPDIKSDRYLITLSETAEKFIAAYPSSAMPGMIIFLRTDLPEDTEYLVCANGKPVSTAENDPSILWFYMPEEDITITIK